MYFQSEMEQRLSVSDSLFVQQRIKVPYICSRRCGAQKIARKSFNSAPDECVRPRLPIVYRYTRLRVSFQQKRTTTLVIVLGRTKTRNRDVQSAFHVPSGTSGKGLLTLSAGRSEREVQPGLDLKKKPIIIHSFCLHRSRAS